VPVTRPGRGHSGAGVLALLSCAALFTLSACDTSAPASGGGHEGHETHEAPHSESRPTSEHRTTAPTRPSEYNPKNCPTGLVC
jgi:hypothetical protein